MMHAEDVGSVDDVDAFLRHVGVYVKDGGLRAAVLERLLTLHGLDDDGRARATEAVRLSGIEIGVESHLQAAGLSEGVQAGFWSAEIDDQEGPDGDDIPGSVEPVALPPSELERCRGAAEALLASRRLGRVPRHRVLTAAEEIGLALLVRPGGHPLAAELPQGSRKTMEEGGVAAEAFDAMVEHNMRLVWSISRGYGDNRLEWDDVRSSGMLGLLRAVEKFDATRGLKFSTYATWWIRQSISRAIANESSMIRLPVHLVEQIDRVRSAWRRLESVSPVVRAEDVARDLGITRARVLWLLNVSLGTYSLDKHLASDGDLTLSDLLVGDFDVEESYSVHEATEVIERVLSSRLTDRERAVIRMRFGLATGEVMTLDEVGKVLGVTRERIRQIQEKTLGKLRSELVREHLVAFHS